MTPHGKAIDTVLLEVLCTPAGSGAVGIRNAPTTLVEDEESEWNAPSVEMACGPVGSRTDGLFSPRGEDALPGTAM